MTGMGDSIIKINPKMSNNVIIGENIRLVRGDITEISPKNNHEKAHTENIAARVIAIDDNIFTDIRIARGFFLILNFIADIESEMTIIPSVAKKESHKPISNKALGDIASIKTKATKSEVMLSASLFIKYETYTIQSIMTAREADDEKPVMAR